MLGLACPDHHHFVGIAAIPKSSASFMNLRHLIHHSSRLNDARSS